MLIQCSLVPVQAATHQHPELFPWEESQAIALPNGELLPDRRPYKFFSGQSVRYIDFERGNDSGDGSRSSPWKHHPWDNRAAANVSAQANQLHTYVFRGGVTYRGSFIIPPSARGTASGPIRLTRDPDWGEGPAVISGGSVVTGWTRGAHPAMPAPEHVWTATVNFLPRNLWWVSAGDQPVRMRLARWPNWKECNSNDPMAEWPTWDQPRWWTGENVMKVGNNTKHVGIAASLPRPLEDLVGGTVWTEWGIVMGSPYPARIEAVNHELDGIAFRGPWTYDALERIITGNRFHLENLPRFLDEPGEFWVERLGESEARIYLWLPENSDPNEHLIEAAEHYSLFSGSHIEHIHWSGLHFRFGNVDWDYDHPFWARPHLQTAAILLRGSGDGIVIENNTFEHLPMPIRISLANPTDVIGRVDIRDNVMRYTDQGAATIKNAVARDNPHIGNLRHVSFLRNELEQIGMRIISGEHGHAVDIRFPETSHIAGNFLHRIGGWGLAVFGGKPSDAASVGAEAPLSRHLIHHNRVEDVLLKSNDWGGIETWQGGNFYVYNNIVINALGFKHWVHAQNNPDNPSSFGHAYYLDGSFKNYLFNNIGLGLNNEVGTPLLNLSAIQNIFSFENWFFNNSFHRFAVATRQQAPEAGRVRYLGNVFSDVSHMLYRHAEPADTLPDPNAEHYRQAGQFDYPTLAFTGNRVHRLDGAAGTFEETGLIHRTLAGFSQALEKVGAQATEAGLCVSDSPFIDPDKMDWRPAVQMTENAADIRVFVPWALARTVGEWHFTPNRINPDQITDEHWFMHRLYGERQQYRTMPRFPLMGNGFTLLDFVDSPLETWISGALRFAGDGRYLRVRHEVTEAAEEPFPTLSAGEDNLLLEIVFRSKANEGLLVGKMERSSGYRVDLHDGGLLVKIGDGKNVHLASLIGADYSSWTHLLVELDRMAGKLRIYVDGILRAGEGIAESFGSLANRADFHVGGGEGQLSFCGEIAFLRVALSSLEESRTCIRELYSWQTNGPHHYDFTGRDRRAANYPGAIIPIRGAGESN